MTEEDRDAWLDLAKQMVNTRYKGPQYPKEKHILDSEWVPKKCTCGVESAGLGGEHSKWCEKEGENEGY
jgi:hypothetical protein